VLLAGAQRRKSPFLDVDGSSQCQPTAGAHPMRDLVAAHPGGNGVVSTEDQWKGGVGAHWTTVPYLTPDLRSSTGQDQRHPGLAHFRPLGHANFGSKTGLN